jgi:hypothetical protein
VNIPKEVAKISSINRSPDLQRLTKIGQLSVQKKLPISFKLDLSKCKQD